jgi:DNA polymerase elongation subunit (family B)
MNTDESTFTRGSTTKFRLPSKERIPSVIPGLSKDKIIPPRNFGEPPRNFGDSPKEKTFLEELLKKKNNPYPQSFTPKRKLDRLNETLISRKKANAVAETLLRSEPIKADKSFGSTDWIHSNDAPTNPPPQYDFTQYGRKRLGRQLVPSQEDIDFFFCGADYSVKSVEDGSVVHIYGIARTTPNVMPPLDLSNQIKVETPICVNVRDFRPHMWLEKKPDWTANTVHSLIADLEDVLKNKYPWPSHLTYLVEGGDRLICDYRIEKAKELDGYKGEEVMETINIFTVHPEIVKAIRHVLEYPAGADWTPNRKTFVNYALSNPKVSPFDNNARWKPDRDKNARNSQNCCLDYISYGIKCAGKGQRSDLKIYEADVDFVLRFLTDNLYEPSSWFRIKREKYRWVPVAKRNSKCDLEIDVSYKDLFQLKKHQDPDVESLIPDFVNLSFDTEFYTHGRKFPKKGVDDCLQIGVVVWNQHSPDDYRSYDFTLGDMGEDDTEDRITTFWFDSERTLLEGLSKFIQAVDPDMITGYNISNFDFPYLEERAKAVGAKDFSQITRCKGKSLYTSVKEAKGRKVTTTNCTGRIIMDVYTRMVLEKQLPDYTLGFVSKKFLTDERGDAMTKVEFDVTMIALFQQTVSGRRKMRTYVEKDAYLPKKLCETLGYTGSNIVTSRIAKIPWQLCLDREQGAKIAGRLRQECFGCSYDGPPEKFIPILKKTESRGQKRASSKRLPKYKGAVVIRPKPGFYRNPVLVFDAASMYPSIVQMLNLCHSTRVDDEYIEKLGLVEDKDYRRIKNREYTDTEVIEIPDPNMPAFMIHRIETVTGEDGKKKEIYHGEGILPRIERELGNKRRYVRKVEMDSVKKNIERCTAALEALEKRALDDAVTMYPEETKQRLSLMEEIDRIKGKKPVNQKALKSLSYDLKVLNSKVLKFMWTLEGLKKDKEEYDLLKRDLARYKIQFKLLDDTQNGIKMWMNSVYGISGDSNSPYYQPEIATTITGTGRWMTNLVKIEVEKRFNRKNGYPFDAIVIYGDTDSVMVWLRGFDCVAEAFSFGNIIKDYINKLFVDYKPAEFNFEKLYTNFHLITAKHYFGLKHMPVEEGDSRPTLDVKGLRYKKRGNAAFYVEVCDKVCKMLAENGDLDGAVEYVHQEVQRLKTRKIHVADFEKRQRLSKDPLEYGKEDDGDSNSRFDDGGSSRPSYDRRKKETVVVGASQLKAKLKKYRKAKESEDGMHHSGDEDDNDDDDNNNHNKGPSMFNKKKKLKVSHTVQLAKDSMIKDTLHRIKNVVESHPPFYTTFQTRHNYDGDIQTCDIRVPVYIKDRVPTLDELNTVLDKLLGEFECVLDSPFVDKEVASINYQRQRAKEKQLSNTLKLKTAKTHQLLKMDVEDMNMWLQNDPETFLIRVSTNTVGRTVTNKDDITPLFELKMNVTMACKSSSVQYSAGDYIGYVVAQSTDKNASVAQRVVDPYDAIMNNTPIDVKYYMEDLSKGLTKIFAGIMGYGMKPDEDGTPKHMQLEEVTDKKTDQKKWRLANSQKREITKRLFGVELVKNMLVRTPILKDSAMATYMQRAPTCARCHVKIQDNNRIPDLRIRRKTGKPYSDDIKEKICRACSPHIDKLVEEKKATHEKLVATQKACLKKCVSCLGPGSEDLVDKCINLNCPTYRDKIKISQEIPDIEDIVNLLDLKQN